MTDMQTDLVLAHLHMAEQGAKSYARGKAMALTYEDYLSAAYYGLVRAARAYDPDKGTFSTYAYHHINAHLKRVRRDAMRSLGWVSAPTKAERANGQTAMPRVLLIEPAPVWIENIAAPERDSTDDMRVVYAGCRTPRDHDLIRRRCAGEDYRTIAAAFGISWQRVHQLERAILARAKTKVRDADHVRDRCARVS